MNILTVDYHSPDAPQDFARSLQETGFGVLKNHPISYAKVEKIYAEWFAYFNSEAKFKDIYTPVLKDPNDDVKQDGYVPLKISEKAKGAKIKDIKEFYQLYFPWGRYPSNISDLTRELFYELFALGKELTHWLEAYMPEEARSKLSEPLSRMLSMEKSQFRIIHYPGLAGDEEADAVRAAAHEDINLITLLPAATEPGLQVLGADDKWYDVVPDPGTLVINIGDMLQEATGHFYRSTSHRVLNPEGADMTKARLSMPLFIHPRDNVRLSERYTAGEYLNERLRELGVI
jgi:isopenicillin N synthase-like dioxygenase